MKKKISRSKSKKKIIRTIRWQHEDTGRIVDMPVGKNPGHRWYKIPSKKSKNQANIRFVGDEKRASKKN